ncbi:MAG: acylphosphatase [Planctomycetota bacterium]
MEQESRTVFFSGAVQGVGFRWTARDLAAGFAVTGYVRNLPDGRVELFAEGSPAEIDRFLAALRSAMRSYIRGENAERGPATGRFGSFSIRF